MGAHASAWKSTTEATRQCQRTALSVCLGPVDAQQAVLDVRLEPAVREPGGRQVLRHCHRLRALPIFGGSAKEPASTDWLDCAPNWDGVARPYRFEALQQLFQHR